MAQMRLMDCIKNLCVKLTAQTAKIDALTTKIDALTTKVDGIATEVDLDELTATCNDSNVRIQGIETNLAATKASSAHNTELLNANAQDMEIVKDKVIYIKADTAGIADATVATLGKLDVIKESTASIKETVDGIDDSLNSTCTDCPLAGE